MWEQMYFLDTPKWYFRVTEEEYNKTKYNETRLLIQDVSEEENAKIAKLGWEKVKEGIINVLNESPDTISIKK